MNYNKLVVNPVIVILLVIAFSAVNYAESQDIAINFEYGFNPNYDSDNNGIETEIGAIDFTVEKTQFNWQVDQENLCTRYEVISEDNQESNFLCNGDSGCCGFIDLAPTDTEWDSDLVLAKSVYGTTNQNTVAAQVIYVDYSLDPQNPYQDIRYSDWAALQANFELGFSAQSSVITVVLPNSTVDYSENIPVKFTIDADTNAVYSVNGAENQTPVKSSGNNQTNFTDSIDEVFENGVHNITIYELEGALIESHQFIVNDTTAPQINISPKLDGSYFNGTTKKINIKINSSEAGNYSYSINSANPVAGAFDSSKTVNIEVDVKDGQNSLTIEALDINGNKLTKQYNFNYLWVGGSCSDGVQNFHDNQNESGVDCGGSCSNCVDFTLETDKQSYQKDEQVTIVVSHRSDANHNITIVGPSLSTSMTSVGGATYFIFPEQVGTYTITVKMHYLNLSPQTVTKTFAVTEPQNPLQASIVASKTQIGIGNIINLKAQLTGNTSLATYEWNFVNPSTVDSTVSSINRTYDTPGNYIVNLTAYWDGWNTTSSVNIKVHPNYNITVNVTDENDEPLTADVIKIGDLVVQNKVGHFFNVPYGQTTLEVNKSGYLNYSNTFTVNENEKYNIRLGFEDNIPPTVSLVGPLNGTIIDSPNVNFIYEVTDQSLSTCTILVSEDGNWWIDVNSTLKQNSMHSYSHPLNGTGLQWRVECVDSKGYVGLSEIRSIGVSSSVESIVTLQEIDVILSNITEIKKSIARYSRLESQAAQAMKLEDNLDIISKELERTNRDLFNLKWRKVTEEERKELRDEYLSKVEDLKNNITTELVVVKDGEFVSYPTDISISEISEIYAKKYLDFLSNSQIADYSEQNQEIQKQITLTTNYKHLELTSYSGQVKRLTLVERKIDSNLNGTDVAFIEQIPKDVATNALDINFYFKAKVLESDPVIELLEDTQKYAFSLESFKSPVEIQKINSVGVLKEYNPKAKSPTGFAVLSLEPITGSGSRLIIEIIIVIILGGFYLVYSGRIHAFGDNTTKEVKQLIKDTYNHIESKNYAKSKENYTNLSNKYKDVKPKDKSQIYSQLTDIRHKLNALYVLDKIKLAENAIANNAKKDALSIYQELTRVYKTIPKEYKKEVYQPCVELHKKMR